MNVFVPTTPNPTTGFFLMVPERDLRPLPITVDQAFKLVMSAGLLAPDGSPSPQGREGGAAGACVAAPETR